MSRSQTVPVAGGVPGPQLLVSVLGFEHTSAPLHTLPSEQSAAPVHVHVQSFSHPSPFVVFMSSHCSAPVTSPSPQRAITHAIETQIMPDPQLVPSGGAVPGLQRLPSELGIVQVSAPLHALPSEQSAAPAHVHVQSFSHPSPLVVFMSSQSSPLLTMPSPQPGVTHTPPMHTFVPRHVVPSGRGVPATHALDAVPAIVHCSVPLHGSPSLQSALAEHVNVQSLSQPSPSVPFMSSQSSPAAPST
jgi:hypothetical protein